MTPSPTPPTTPLDEKALDAASTMYSHQLRDAPEFRGKYREFLRPIISAYLAALPPAAPAEPTPNTHTFVPAMDGGSASCAECGESWPCAAWIEQQRVRRDDPALLRQAVVDCLPPEIVKLAEDVYAPTLGGMLMEYVAELEGQLEDRAKSAPLPSGEPTSEAVAWHQHPSVVETARQLHRHLATANRSAQWLNEAYELCQRLGDAVSAVYAHPLPSDAPVDLSAVEAAIEEFEWATGQVDLFPQPFETEKARKAFEGKVAAKEACRAALLSLYRTALSGVTAKEAGEANNG